MEEWSKVHDVRGGARVGECGRGRWEGEGGKRVGLWVGGKGKIIGVRGKGG